MNRLTRFFFVSFLIIAISSCRTSRKILPAKADNTNVNSLHYLGQYILPHDFLFKKTTVGGLSGIDYDPKLDLYYLISDDRSEKNPARFYTAKIAISNSGISKVEFKDVHFLRQKDKALYPRLQIDPNHTPDPESIRVNPIENSLFWSSEGERIVTDKDTVLIDPSINVINQAGVLQRTLALPPNLKMQAVEKGPRQNGVIEGLAFDSEFKNLYANIEDPLYEDSPKADTMQNIKYFTRILKIPLANENKTIQYAYALDPINFKSSLSKTAFRTNGVSEILWVDKDKLIAIERMFALGAGFSVRLYLIDLSQAEEIEASRSLKEHPPKVLAKKTLLLDVAQLGVYIDNIEGITFGPVLPNGHRSLVLVTDNNFNAQEKTQFFLFEVN